MITEASRTCLEGGNPAPSLVHLKDPYDAEALRELEQMVDRGDATLEALPESWAYTHRLITSTGAWWLVFIREGK